MNHPRVSGKWGFVKVAVVEILDICFEGVLRLAENRETQRSF